MDRIIKAIAPPLPRRNPERYRRCISKSDKRGSSQEKEKVKERSAQIEENASPFRLASFPLPHRFVKVGKGAYIYIYLSSEAERRRGKDRDDKERIGGFTFLIYRLRCQRSPSSRQYLENLKGAAGLEG